MNGEVGQQGEREGHRQRPVLGVGRLADAQGIQSRGTDRAERKAAVRFQYNGGTVFAGVVILLFGNVLPDFLINFFNVFST